MRALRDNNSQALPQSRHDSQVSDTSKSLRSWKPLYITDKRFVKLWYGWDDNPMFENNNDYKEVFKALLKLMSPIDTTATKRKHTFEVKRGSAFISVPKIMQVSRVSNQKVRTALEKFEENNAIEKTAYNGVGTMITVVNYAKYQDKGVEQENIIYFNKHIKLVEEGEEVIKPPKQRKKTSIQQAPNKLITRSYSVKEENKDSKEVSKYEDKENLQTDISLKEGREDETGIPATAEITAINTPNFVVERLEREKLLNLTKKIYIKAFGINTFSLKDKSLVNQISKENKNTFIRFMQENNVLQEELEEIMLYISNLPLEDQKKKLAYVITKIPELLFAGREQRKKEEQKAKRQNLPPLKITLREDLEEINKRFKESINHYVGGTVAKAWFIDKVLITGFKEDNKTPILLFANEKIKNCIHLHYSLKFDKALDKTFERCLKEPTMRLSKAECERFEVEYKCMN